MSRRYNSSNPCEWVSPRGRSGLNRDQIDGPVMGMEYDDGFWSRTVKAVARLGRRSNAQ